MSLLANSNAIETGGYLIQRSLRFRSAASAYLSRTVGTTNRQTYTFSFFVKRGQLGSTQNLYEASTNSTNQLRIRFASDDTLQVYDYQSAYNLQLNSAQVFRDPSAWYSIIVAVDTTQATASNRAKIYVNGNQVTAFTTATYPSQNYNTMVNYASATNNNFCRNAVTAADYFDGYLAEVNFIDGQALTPSSFGQTDSVTGVWTPNKYTGTYGTNGFYLPFSDNTSATTLAYDKSGNGNNWTANNISTTAGVTYDSMTDVPTLTSATAANYCVLNPLKKGSCFTTLNNGNLYFLSTTTPNYGSILGTIGMTSGKYYWEVTTATATTQIGIALGSIDPETYFSIGTAGWCYNADGTKRTNNVDSAYGASFTTGDVIGVAFDATAGSLTFYKNGVSQGVAFSGLAADTYFPAVADYTGGGTAGGYFNAGQQPITPPTDFKALNTFNLPDPTIKKPNQYMDATLWTGDGASSRAITNTAGFQPDLVWVKNRSAGWGHRLSNSVVGANYALESNNTAAELFQNQYGYLSSFNTNGFTLQAGSTDDYYTNNNGEAYVGWQWKESATAGFDIVTWTGTGFGYTVNHNLGVAPAMLIVKNRSASPSDWWVYHKNLSSGYGINLNTTGAQQSGAWGSITSTTFPIGSLVYSGGTTNYVAYLFAEISGYSAFGSYTGNGSADGPFVYCGFRPKYVMVKCSSSTGDWVIVDTARGTYNVVGPELYADLSNAEATGNNFDVTSNGFKLRGSWNGVNGASATYIYAAFAENPFKYSNAR